MAFQIYDKRSVLVTAIFMLLLLVFADRLAAAETLYNGIELPETWPPHLASLPDALPPAPYLLHPPAVIPIDVGRQLFVDDFLIADTTMTRATYTPVPYPLNPVLSPDRPWEQLDGMPMAMPFSGGVWVDPADGKFKMWYMAGYNVATAIALSDDGLTWRKPDLGDGTNVVYHGTADTVWRDADDPDLAKRYKLFAYNGGADSPLGYATSADGIHWQAQPWHSGIAGDRTTVFYNPFRRKWVFSIRNSTPNIERGRVRRYWEVASLDDARAADWGAVDKPPLWVGTDRGLDLPRVDIGISPQLYNLDCTAYESVMLGLFSIFHGRPAVDNGEGRLVAPGRPKTNEVCVGFSRDGFNWTRPDHAAFIGVSERRGAWNWGNVQSTAPGCLVVGDLLYFYVSGRAGEAASKSNDAGGSTGLAILRRDGFASMDAVNTTATLTTRPVSFQGRYLFVNVDDPDGTLRVEVLDAQDHVLAPFSRENCTPIHTNATLQPVVWREGADLAALRGQPVKFRFILQRGSLYAFWVSPRNDGCSNGYVAGGGPGFTGPTDTMGRAAYPKNMAPWASAGAAQTVRDTDGDGSEWVTLDGRKSTDTDDAIAHYTWFAEDKPVGEGVTARVHLAVGTHQLTLAVTNATGATGYDKVTITVLPQTDSLPPLNYLACWLKADAITNLTDGQPVAAWSDASGNKVDATQPNTDKRPTWSAKAANGQPALTFDGVNDCLQTAYYRGLLFTYHHVTIFAVFRPTGKIGSHGIISQGQSGLFVDNDGGGCLAYTGENYTRIRTTDPAQIHPDTWHIASLVRAGSAAGETRLYVNGIHQDNGTAMPYHNINAEFGMIGCLYAESYPWRGDIAEILVYGESLTESERQNVTRYLSNKYRIPLR